MAMTTPHQGFLNRQTAPLVRAGTDSLKAIANVLGPSQKPFVFQPDQVRSVETFTLQRLAEGKPEYIGFSITTAMQSSNAAIFQLMPMMRTNAITFIQEYFEFNKELATVAPKGAPPSYIEVEKRTREVTLEHYILGATTTVQELRTAEGQFIFRGKLITLAVGFIEVAELLAIDTLLNTPSLFAQWYVEANQHPIDLQRTGRMVDLFWDILRLDNGFAELVNWVRQSMSAQNIKPTHVIMTEGMRGIIMASPMMQEYYRRGAEAASNATKIADAIGDNWDGLQLIVTRAVELRKKDLRIEPLVRTVPTGQHVRIDHIIDSCDPNDWCSKYYTGQIFSMGTNTWATVGFEDGIDNDGRFAADGNLSDWHYALCDALDDHRRKTGVPIYEHQYDMFIYLNMANATSDTVANVCELWGHMEPWALSDKTADRTTIGITAAAKRALPAKVFADIEAGLNDIHELFERKPSPEDVEAITSAHEPGWKAGRFGVAPVPSDAPDGYIPTGYGRGGGYLELGSTSASIDAGLKARAVAFKDSIVKLHKFFVSVFGQNHPALDPANAPAYYRNAAGAAANTNTASLLNFIENVLDHPKGFLWVPNQADATDVYDVDSPYAALNLVLLRGASPTLTSALSPARIGAFEREFSRSTFSRRYDAYVVGERSSRARTRAAGAVSADTDGGEAFGEDEEGTQALQRFHRREVVAKELEPTQIAALYSHVIQSVRSKTAPATVTTDLLKAWSTDAVPGEVRDTLEERVEEGSTATGLVVSLEALRAARAELAPGSTLDLQLSSPLDPGRALNIEAVTAEMEGAGQNVDLLRTTLTGARPVIAGVRAPPVDGADERRQRAATFAAGVPAFAPDAFTDIVGDRVVVNANIRDRFRRYGSEANWLLRASGQMLVLGRINKQTLKRFYALNIPPPVAWLGEQFNRRYRTASMIFCSKPSTREFGNIRYLDADTHIGRNAILKNLMVNVGIYMGATIEDVQDYFIAHDVAVVGHKGGETTKAFDQNEWSLHALANLPLNGPSILWFMVPADSLVGRDDGKAPLTHDIRGRWDPVAARGSGTQVEERPHFKSALFYNSKLELYRIVTPTSEDWHRFHRRAGTYNTITHQALQRVCNPHTKNYDLAIMSEDVFKDRVYAGCAPLRESILPRHYEKTHYKEVAVGV